MPRHRTLRCRYGLVSRNAPDRIIQKSAWLQPTGRIKIAPGIPPDEISLIGAHFGGMEEWRKNLAQRIKHQRKDGSRP